MDENKRDEANISRPAAGKVKSVRDLGDGRVAVDHTFGIALEKFEGQEEGQLMLLCFGVPVQLPGHGACVGLAVDGARLQQVMDCLRSEAANRGITLI